MMGNESSSVDFDTDFFNKYATLTYYLSKGAFGNVYGPIQWKEKRLAIKQVMFADGERADRKNIEEKEQIWNSLEHKYLVRIFSVNKSQLPKVMYIVMEFAAGGSLNSTLRILGSENKLPIYVITDWTKQIAEGMLYLHQKNIVHRDLKPSNILLSEPFDFYNPRKTITLKITDFDDVKRHDHTTTMSFVGTVPYMAPEVFLNQQFSKASDVWSFGVLTWEMLSGDTPHKGLQLPEIIYKSQSGELNNLPIAPSFPEDYKYILEHCWKSTCEKRFSFQQILVVLITLSGDSYRTDPVLVKTIITKYAKPNLTNKLHGDVFVRTYAIAILDKELFVVSVSSSKCDVYDSTKFSLNRQIDLQDLNEPMDIVSCSRNMCLYILHYKGSSFGILRVDSNGKLLKKWSIGNDYSFSLSVTGEGNIIVTLSFQNKLREYSSDGKLIREIDLSQDTGIFHPACAIQLLSNGDFAISHGGGYLRDESHRVCIVDADGKVQKSFRGQLHDPSYLLVDSDGYVMVVDYYSDRVLLLDSNLEFKKEILSKEHHRFAVPMKILLDESTGRLFVADDLWKSEGRISIFDCK